MVKLKKTVSRSPTGEVTSEQWEIEGEHTEALSLAHLLGLKTGSEVHVAVVPPATPRQPSPNGRTLPKNGDDGLPDVSSIVAFIKSTPDAEHSFASITRHFLGKRLAVKDDDKLFYRLLGRIELARDKIAPAAQWTRKHVLEQDGKRTWVHRLKSA